MEHMRFLYSGKQVIVEEDEMRPRREHWRGCAVREVYMEREKYIRVPKDKKAMEDYDYGIETEEQMEDMILSEEQYSKLHETGVFDVINDRCDIIIDEYEEEVLELDKIPIALEVVTQLINDNKNEDLIRLKEMLNLALAYQTIVGFDF